MQSCKSITILECTNWQEQRDSEHDLELKNIPISLQNAFITFSHIGVVYRIVALWVHLKNLSEVLLAGLMVFY